MATARKHCPEVEIASDWIVGFCGETEEDFAASVSLMEEVRFQSSYVFKYSPREGTPALKLEDDVPEDVKKARNQTLLDLQERISLEKNRARVGRVEEVLVEGPSKTIASRVTGRSRTHQLVHFPGDASLAGTIVQVKVAEATALSLKGERVQG
ncbi:MAG: TRAM domain-containing protein [Planctomycetota bacterium]|nr:TRAM domain-containing protein [Planctomycetota bacterium]